MSTSINPIVYRPLLDSIAMGESNGNYNAYFGNASNISIQFAAMTVADVLYWQQEYVLQGSPSSAVGRYQIIRPTLVELMTNLTINPKTLFDQILQDRLGVALLHKRGAYHYMSNKLSRREFAANLAKEWAALPKITGENPETSYYAGDGINKAQITINEIYTALATIKSYAVQGS